MDGAKQREALTAAGRALDQLAAGNGDGALMAAKRADELDQIGVFVGLPDAVAWVGGDPENGAAWDALADAVGPGPLREQVARVRRG